MIGRRENRLNFIEEGAATVRERVFFAFQPNRSLTVAAL
jgi:hypothetical protein